MRDHLLGQVDYSSFQRWLARLAGRELEMLVFDASGKPVWGGEAMEGALYGRRVAQEAADVSGVQRLDVDADSVLLFHEVLLDTTRRGFVAAVIAKNAFQQAPHDVDRAADALEDVAAGIADDITAKADLDKLTEELSECYEALHLVYALDRHNRNGRRQGAETFRKMLQETAAHLNVDVVAFVRPGDNVCLYATPEPKAVDNLDLVLVEMRGDLFRFVQSSREPCVLNEPDDPRRAYIFTDMPYRVLACPISIGRRVDALAVLVKHMHKPAFSNSDLRLAEVLANHVSAIVNQVLMLENGEKFTRQLAMAMVEAVEAKDPYTRGHSERVNCLSMEIGRALRLTEEELDHLHWGSLLHDVGKIGIPDAILCKPSRLTRDEYTFIRVHPERSYEILRHVDELKDAVSGARHHQEMFDGSGYPHGLAGDRIPLHARIIAVADTYDSITSSRAYRAGRSHEVAMLELRRVSGTQLDPSLVSLFERLCASEPAWLAQFNIRREPAAVA